MFLDTKKGKYWLQKNYRDAFKQDVFEDLYIEELMDKYPYIVGDISSETLRLKGFDLDPKGSKYYKGIKNYLETSCSFGCPFFILRRVKSKEEYDKIIANSKYANEEEKPLITPLVKENFDKESLVLESIPKTKPNIVLDVDRITTIPLGKLSDDLVESIKQEKQTNQRIQKPVEEVKETTASYVSASPDFDPSKSNSYRFNKQNKHKNNNNNNNKKQKGNEKK